MTGLRPLMLCLVALLNTAFWAGILHFLRLFTGLAFSPPMKIVLLAGIFLLSLAVLASLDAGQPNGSAPDSDGDA
jgi:hypothetical protein